VRQPHDGSMSVIDASQRQPHPLIDEFLTYFERECAEASLVSYRLALYRADRELPYGLVVACEEEIEAWVFNRRALGAEREWGPRTKAAAFAILKSFFDWATRPRHERMDWHPMLGLKPPKVPAGVPRTPSDDQLDAVLIAAQDPYRLWAYLAAYEGMRCIEIAGCEREDVDEQDTWIRGKGRKERVVPTHPLVWALVRDLPSGHIARRPDGSQCSANRVSGYAANHFDAIGYPKMTLHRLRHWYLTSALDACGNLRVVQELAGHSSPKTTAVYTMVSSAARRAAVSALPRLGVAADAG
jgi:integrase/recombinase XerC